MRQLILTLALARTQHALQRARWPHGMSAMWGSISRHATQLRHAPHRTTTTSHRQADVTDVMDVTDN